MVYTLSPPLLLFSGYPALAPVWAGVIQEDEHRMKPLAADKLL